jgi:serine/threonine-protein kinase HipA
VNARTALICVDLGGGTVRAGTLWSAERPGRASFTFQYDDAWTGGTRGFELDPDLLLVPGRKVAAPYLFGGLADSAPDRWGRTLLARAERLHARQEGRTPRTLSEMDYLLGVSDLTRSGALRFRASEDGPFLAEPGEQDVPPLLELPRLLAAAQGFLDDPEGEDDLKLLLAPGSSLGGARPKASVRAGDGSLAIAKFPRTDDSYSISTWEHLTLEMARDSGIPVAASELLQIEGRAVILLRRFDRTRGTRIPMISAMALTGGRPEEAHGYLEIAEAIQRFGARPRQGLKDLWRRMVFTVLVSNTDDHMRNHAFLREGPGWVLSPAYDINPTPGEIKPRALATALGEDYHATSASLEIALAAAPYFDLEEADAWRIIQEVAAVTRTWLDRARAAGCPTGECDMMASAFEHEDLALALGGS